ncbi:hypothetical protein H5410_045497 [Solanum commersonii]|uniref:Uncharacterized protein n=1 Tax=Solanum commersonii TaxID=4109 RepID=A0A9J5XBS4_SOLCO|nr:hypothetical protein H5410_045497 [Solanum commersonii]
MFLGMMQIVTAYKWYVKCTILIDNTFSITDIAMIDSGADRSYKHSRWIYNLKSVEIQRYLYLSELSHNRIRFFNCTKLIPPRCIIGKEEEDPYDDLDAPGDDLPLPWELFPFPQPLVTQGGSILQT